MTTLIFQDWLKSFNNNMASQNHDPVVEKQKYSNPEKLKCIAKAMEILESSESFNPDSDSKVIIRLIQEDIKKSFVQPTITSLTISTIFTYLRRFFQCPVPSIIR
jgi:uncharacterized radical SAM superfamily Fe-S cluster-containing enzyme